MSAEHAGTAPTSDPLAGVAHEPGVAKPDAILVADGLRRTFGGLVAVDVAHVEFQRGCITGLIGPNGAGKTTFIDAITGYTPRGRSATTGSVQFAGERLDRLGPHERARRGFSRTFQSLELFDDLTVEQNLLVAAGTPTFWSTIADAVRPRRMRVDAVDETLGLLGLTDVADRRPEELSSGRRHLVALGRALASRPSLVLLDEPAAGLDPPETRILAALLRELPGRGVTVLLVDHDMDLVFGVCDRVHVLELGSIVSSGPPAQVRTDPVVIAAYLGRSTASTDTVSAPASTVPGDEEEPA
jgi:branched-chain amino acid transport system ATP-binding protein